jgi:signal transduction histidine kinase
MPRKVDPAGERPRLVQQSDGYAYYVKDVPSPQPDPAAGKSRRKPRPRQRAIRATITTLLVVPLLSLVVLWGYSFATTIGGYLAIRANIQINNDIGAPLQTLVGQLDQEAALTYTLGSLPTVPPAAPSPSKNPSQAKALKQVQAEAASLRQQILAQRPKTDAAVAAFQAGESKLEGPGGVSARVKPLAAALAAQLRSIPVLRAEADGNAASPLTVFEGYNAVGASPFPYLGASLSSRSSVALFPQSMSALFTGQALAEVATEDTLISGALANGGVLTGPAYRLFARTVAEQRQLDDSAAMMLNTRNAAGADANVAAIDSPRFKGFQTLEDEIVDAGPDARLPASVDPRTWDQQTRSILGQLAAGATQERVTVTSDAEHSSTMTEYQVLGVGGAGLLMVLIPSLLLWRFGRRVSREVQVLRATARELAFRRLPGVVSRLRGGDDLNAEAEGAPLHLNTKILEITETADAFSAVQRTAIEAAIEQAMLRKAVNNVFRSLARRNQSLVQRQLKMLDQMERNTDDPDALEQLFRLDHLTTRMRRQAEGLIILSGAMPGRGWRKPVPVVEVLRGAIGEIEDYARVDLATDSHDYLHGAGVADVIHLLAELIENAVSYSPPGTRVQVRGGRVAKGYAVEVEDQGLGIHEEVREALNQRLAEPPDFDVADSDQLGLFVVSRLAARHGIMVSLRRSSYGGTTAIVLVPQALVVTEEDAAYLAARERASLPGGGGQVSAGAGAASRQPNGAANGNGHGGSGGRGGWMASAAGAVADALIGRPRQPASGPLPAVGSASGPQAPGAPPAGGPVPAGPVHNGPAHTGPIPADATSVDVGAGGPGGLPRRRKTAGTAGTAAPGPAPGAPSGVTSGPRSSPEQARALLSSIQQGLRSGRDADAGTGDGTGAGPPGGEVR